MKNPRDHHGLKRTDREKGVEIIRGGLPYLLRRHAAFPSNSGHRDDFWPRGEPNGVKPSPAQACGVLVVFWLATICGPLAVWAHCLGSTCSKPGRQPAF